METTRKRLSISKFIKICMVSLLMITSIQFTTTSIEASTVESITDTGYYHTGTYSTPSGGTFWYSSQSIQKIVIDGKVGFCIEPWILIDGWNGYEISYFENLDISNIVYYGWTNTNQTMMDYAVTQMMIWDYVGTTIGETSNTIPNYESLKSAINTKISNHNVTPSFNEDTITLEEYGSVTLTDTNGVLSDFEGDWSSIAGVSVSVSGDKVTITSTGGDVDGSISLTKQAASAIGESLVHRKDNSQAIVVAMQDDPVTMNLNIEVESIAPEYATLTSTKTATETVDISLLKTDIDNNNTLSEVVFDFYRDNVLFASDVSTNEEGIASATYSKTYTYTSGTYTYCSNYDDLNSVRQAEAVATGAYTSKALAQAAADKDAQAGADALASESHTYKAIETQSKTSYYLNPSNSSVNSTITGSGDVDLSLTNKRILGTAVLIKEDSETGSIAQGEATLEGAVFGLYASEDILDPSDSSVVYTSDTLIQEVTIINGTASVEELYLGEYYWKEISPPEGYNLNEEEYTFSLVQDGNEPVVTTTITAYNDVFKGRIKINKTVDAKLSSPLFTLLSTNSGIQIPGVGYTFDIYDRNGTLVDTISTDDDGYATTIDLPYGTHTVQERSEVGYEEYDSFEVVIDEHDKTYSYHIQNKVLQSIIQIEKIDATTGNTIPVEGVSFQLKDSEGNYVSQTLWGIDTFTTNKEGIALLPETLTYGETYTVEEVSGSVPTNYLLNLEGQEFTVNGDEIMTIAFENTAVKGEIEIYKEGEVLVDITTDENGNIDFVYETKGLANAVYYVYAAEDIYFEDLSGNLYYTEGELVDRIITNEEGIATLSNLPLGTYNVQEVEAPSGYVIDDTQYEVTLSYQGELVSLVREELTLQNERIQLLFNFIKKDSTNGALLSDATFGLFAGDDIYNNEGDLLIEEGTLIETTTSNAKGEIIFNADLVMSDYYVEEIEAPINYVMSEDTFEIIVTKDNEDNIYEYCFENDVIVGQLGFLKVGEAFTSTIIEESEFGTTVAPEFNEVILSDSTIRIYAAEDIEPSEGNIYYEKDEMIEELTSSDEIVYSSLLPVGSYYYIEISAPEGYTQSIEKHYFEITADETEAQIVESELENTITTFILDVVKILETSTLKDTSDAYLDVVFGLYAQEAILTYDGEVGIEVDQLIAVLYIDEEGSLLDVPELPYGTYYIKELATNEDYVLDESEYSFTLAYQGEEVMEMVIPIGEDGYIYNDLKTGDILIYKTNSISEEAMEGVEFSISLEKDMSTIIETMTTDEYGYLMFSDLPLGTYYVQETTPSGYIVNDTIYEVVLDEHDILIELEIENEPTEMYFHKVDENNKPLVGAVLCIIDVETGEMIDSWMSDGEMHVVYQLEEGKEYMLVELEAPEGYTIAQSIYFMAEHESTITMVNETAPSTGDSTNSNVLLGLLLTSGLVAISVILRKKKKEGN